jgi:superfamily II DNA/RNA helicase
LEVGGVDSGRQISAFSKGDATVLLCCSNDVRGLDVEGVERVGVVGRIGKEGYRQACGRMGRTGMGGGGEVVTFMEEVDEEWEDTVREWTGGKVVREEREEVGDERRVLEDIINLLDQDDGPTQV